jgi:uncharacterized protein with ParB-like and HNH nuclease domain
MEKQLTLFIDDTEKEHIEFRYEITSYGADYPVDSLVKRIESGTIFVPPFQRRYVWDIYEASKFVESLVLGLPVPGVFLSKEQNKNNNLLIVDGQQRLLTLYYFYKNQFKGKPFRLSGVQNDLENKNYTELALSDKNRLDDSIIHATVIKQDQPDDGESSIYQIFERINSAGRALSPQEIRACIYHGNYNELLVELTKNSTWRSIIGAEHNERLKEEELILRFFSLYFNFSKYKKPMKDFLNRCMSANRNLEIYSDETLTNLFRNTISIVANFIGVSAFRVQRGLHSAILDSVLVGIAKRLERGSIENHDSLRKAYDSLLNNEKYIDYITSATSDEISTIGRINLAINAFESVL